jgi:MFS family permease
MLRSFRKNYTDLPVAIYLTVLLSVLNQIGLKGSRVLVVLYAIHLGASPAAIGILVSAYAICPLLLAVQAGRISDRIGVRRPMVLGSFGVTASLLLPVAWPSLPSLYVSSALMGIGNIFFHVSAHNLVGSLGESHERTSNFGTFSLGAAMSGLLGPVLVGYLIDHFGYSPAYLTLAAVTLVPGVILLCYHGFIPKKVRTSKEEHAGGVRELLRIKSLRGTYITSGLILTGIDLFNFYMPIYGRSVGLGAFAIGVVVGMQAAAAFVVRLWMPWMSKRYGEVRVLTWSLVMSGLTYFLFPMFDSAYVLAAVSFLLGLGLGCGQPLSIILTYNHSPPGRAGEALGVRLTVNKFTQVLVPLVFGSLGGAAGVYPIFWANAVFLLFGGYINSRQPDHAEPEAAAKN